MSPIPAHALLMGAYPAVASWTPATIASKYGWWDYTDAATLTLSGSSILTVADKSGNGRTLPDVGGTSRPTNTRTINGLTAADYDGSNDWAGSNFGFSGLGQPWTAYIVAVSDTASVAKALVGDFFNGTGSRPRLAITAGGQFTITDGTTSISGGTVSVGVAFSAVAYFNGASSAIYIGGSSVASGTGPSGGGVGFGLGNVNQGGPPFWDGAIAESVVQNANGSSQERTDWFAYTLAKYGV